MNAIRPLPTTVFAVVLLVPAFLFAEPAPGQPAPATGAVDEGGPAHLVDDSTLLVAELDWARIDFDALLGLLEDLSGDRPSDIAVLNAIVTKLSDADAGKIYLVAGMPTLTDGIPVIVIPTADADGLAQSLQQVLGKAPESIALVRTPQALVVGKSDRIDASDLRQENVIESIVSALGPWPRLDQTAVLKLPAETRELLAQIWPSSNAIDAFPGLSPSQLVRDIERLALTLRTPPQTQVRLTIEAADADASDRLAALLSQVQDRFSDRLDEWTVRRDDTTIVLEASEAAIRRFRSQTLAARDSVRDSNQVGTMKSLGLAFHSYSGREKHLPPRCFVDPAGNPLHSWAVAILPDIENLALYRQIDLGKRWDAPANGMLERTIPALLGSDGRLPIAHTTLRAPVFPGSVWHGDGPPKKFADITDGAGKTILLIDAPTSTSVHWADPTPWVLSKDDPLADVLGDRESVRVLMADGSVQRFHRGELSNEKLKAMLTIAAGD